MPRRRRLTDLYRVGRLIEFNDGLDPEPVSVWVQKPNEIEMSNIYRRAGAQKSRFMTRADDVDSDEYQDALGDLRELGDDDIILTLAMAAETGRARSRIESQLENDPEGEWAKDDYLQGLFDSWNGDAENPGLKDAYALDPEGDTPEGAEALKIMAELKRFQDQVNERFDVERERLLTEWQAMPKDQVEHLAVKHFVENDATEIFMQEFNRQAIFYAVRDPDERDKRYFGTRQEVDLLPDVVVTRLMIEVNEFIVSSSEGKGLPATTDGSPPSEPPETEDTSQDSGLEAVPA